MKIVRLTSENVKRLHAIEVTPEGAIVTVGGANGAGKSSVLDSIAYALGGQSLVPAEPIRKGEETAKIEVDLGDYVVTRVFTKKDDVTKSNLLVKNKDGITQGTPQAILDKLLGRLTFDPLAFSRTEGKEQRAILARLTGADTTMLDHKRAFAFEKRKEMNREKKIAEVQLHESTFHKDVPEEEIPLDDVTTELETAEKQSAEVIQLQSKAAKAATDVVMAQRSVTEAEKRAAGFEGQIAQIQKLLKEAKAAGKKSEADVATLTAASEQAATLALKAEEALPDKAAIRAKFSEVEQTNRKVRDNKKHAVLQEKVKQFGYNVEQAEALLAEAEKAKADLLESIEYPVPGLKLTDEGVTFNGNPFEQASTSEQLMVSVAIGLALNPTIKVLLIRNGNTLDSKSLKQIAEQAAAADAQIWMEWVTESKDGVSVMIADGEVVQ